MPNAKETARKNGLIRSAKATHAINEAIAKQRRVDVTRMAAQGMESHKIAKALHIPTDRVADYLVSAFKRGEIVVKGK